MFRFLKFGGAMMLRIILVFIVLCPIAFAEDYELQATVQTPDIAFESDTDIGLWARFHFAIHTADFERTREFYRELGFTQGISGFPLTNTHAMARALGMFDECQYELAKGEVLLFPGAANTTGIDLLQWRSPFNDAPPMASQIISGWLMPR
jgi:hypothetical protein